MSALSIRTVLGAACCFALTLFSGTAIARERIREYDADIGLFLNGGERIRGQMLLFMVKASFSATGCGRMDLEQEE